MTKSQLSVHLDIYRNGELVNQFDKDGDQASLDLISALSYYANRKNFHSITRVSISNNYVAVQGLRITITWNNGFKYDYLFKGEELSTYYNY